MINKIGLNEDITKKIIKDLDMYLANLNVLYVKLHNLHWNIEGTSFFQLHEKFEELYNFVSEDLDEVAERILTLGSRPSASLKDFIAMSTIDELESQAISSLESVKIIEKDFNKMLELSRKLLETAEDNKDQGTVDLMAGFIGNYEKTLWMLKAYQS
ncbi:starvation-inducible DNA-binding protein [Natranaerovirga hydrolytica]|uniref:Starvation-inducible DNA-binding protein n=1 Tax=Natranaerovirga hydrolytica TaxID=680378 RepID=A0A4R1MMB8_9FIRM|nr:DNA starvation/stationary phase protection protein [Natranaerovirga hydrolytica]TCK93240.1 starvation-inducible DNA-binding protein [Natranaerovirga hydrolytica]